MAEGNFTEAIRVFTRVQERARKRGDQALLGRSLWGQGIALGRSRSMVEAEELITTARNTFKSLVELRNVATLDATLSEMYGFLGRSAEAAGAAYRAFSSGTSLRYEDHLAFAKRLADDGWILAGVVELKEASLVATESPREKDVPEALGRLAEGLAAIGNHEAALRVLDTAKVRAALVTDPEMRQRLDAELFRALARIEAPNSPRRARTSLDSAGVYFQRIPVEQASLLSLRANLSLKIGDSTAAERDLIDAIALTRSMSASMALGARRQIDAVLRSAQRTLVALAVARGDTASGFTHTIALSEARTSALPSDSVVELRYVVLDDQLLAWLRSRGVQRVAAVPVTRPALVEQVARLVNLLRSGDDTAVTKSVGRALFETLLGPFVAELDAVKRIDIVPDDLIYDVPFSVLVDREGRFVLERHRTQLLIAAQAGGQAVRKNRPGGRLLVGDPAWERSLFPDLEPLRWARREVSSIDSLYANATVLEGQRATKSAFKMALEDAAIVHFAGHARVISGDAAASHLVLSASGNGFADDVLYASEIASLRLDEVDLVVLSSCGPAGRMRLGIGQANGLAEALLDAGAESVVASRWEVDDQATASLMRDLHVALAAGLSPDESLRTAQVGRINTIPLSVVASFAVFGRSSR